MHGIFWVHALERLHQLRLPRMVLQVQVDVQKLLMQEEITKMETRLLSTVWFSNAFPMLMVGAPNPVTSLVMRVGTKHGIFWVHALERLHQLRLPRMVLQA